MRTTVSLVAALFVTLVVHASRLHGQEKENQESKLSKDEGVILELTNKAREEHKLPALKPNKILCEVARAHSKNMAKQEKMEHELDDKKPHERVKEAGYIFRTTGENIASGLRLGPKKAFELWMNSKPHKENILSDKYQEIGIGIARGPKNEIYYTQVFGTRLKVR